MDTEKTRWLDDPKNVKKIIYSLYVVCAVLVGLDLVIHRHTHYGFEGWFGFYGFYGFVACVVLVVAAKQMRRVLMRGEDYYDR